MSTSDPLEAISRLLAAERYGVPMPRWRLSVASSPTKASPTNVEPYQTHLDAESLLGEMRDNGTDSPLECAQRRSILSSDDYKGYDEDDPQWLRVVQGGAA